MAAGRAASYSSPSSSFNAGYGNSHNGAAASEDEDGQNLWSSILSEVSTRSRSKLPPGKNVLLLGEDGAGKTSLIGKLQGIEEYKKGRGMEYLYINVHDEDRDVVRSFQEYVEPGEELPVSPQRRNTSSQDDRDESVILPLGEDTLTHNLGIPVVVVCTKCDAISILEKEHDYTDEHFDFIQSHIRKFCLQYGAALIYTSIKENKNIDIVYKYIVQQLYGFPFNMPAVVVEKDAVFIPAGWDNDKKIGILHENFQTLKPEDTFEDIITKPPVRKFVHEKEIVAEDDQVFLMKQQSQLAKQPPSNAGRPDASPRVPGGSPRTPSRSGTSNVASVSPVPAGTKKIDPNMKAGTTSEGVLANFFNSLLSKKTGSPGPGGSGSPAGNSGGNSLPTAAKKTGQKPVLTDVQAELERISRKPDIVSPTSPTSPTESEAS
ncbi:cytoplasmic dynein 1 light intermediate chain 1 isoform X4 [Hyla sarda]|uniref:cytoplasmic dynein 1 light intermediate chain 1 isoform X4 n=1 Tax=Hyla sarda TaxID=327740 RepID=UPI0024C2FD12|nr:cytoplasmic dynein 1 light intermediate chain 1 isoform X4 [Hyla sarda]